MTKVICMAGCLWRGTDDQVLHAQNPFYPDAIIDGCPDCKAIDSISTACDEPDCWSAASCGTPTRAGYRQTCGKHRPKPE